MKSQMERVEQAIRGALAAECRGFENVGLLDASDTQRIVNGCGDAVQLLNEQFAGLVAETVQARLTPHVRREERGDEPAADEPEQRERMPEYDRGAQP